MRGIHELAKWASPANYFLEVSKEAISKSLLGIWSNSPRFNAHLMVSFACVWTVWLVGISWNYLWKKEKVFLSGFHSLFALLLARLMCLGRRAAFWVFIALSLLIFFIKEKLGKVWIPICLLNYQMKNKLVAGVPIGLRFRDGSVFVRVFCYGVCTALCGHFLGFCPKFKGPSCL